MRFRSKKHYSENKGYYQRRNKRHKAKMRALLLSLKEGKPCIDCEKVYPTYVMDFDHRNRSEKRFNVSRAGLVSERVLLAEIAKCDLVCANCHRERTYGATGRA